VKLSHLAFFVSWVGSLATVSFAQDPATPTTSQTPAPASRGVAVVGLGADSADATWPLAQGVYADGALRPSGIDEPHARVLAGEAPDANAAAELKELAEVRSGIHGDDAASRQLLRSIAERVHVKNVLVLFVVDKDTAPSARLFFADTATFDAANYQPDDGSGSIRSWSGAVRSLSRLLTAAPSNGPVAPSVTPTTAVVTAPVAPKTEPKPGSKPFYLSPWFWGAIGAAAFGGLAVFLVTRDTSDGQIHLQMQVPK
jgi:hypothetical protein